MTKCAGVTKRAGSPSNLTRFGTLVTKRAVVTKRAATLSPGDLISLKNTFACCLLFCAAAPSLPVLSFYFIVSLY